MSTGSAPSLHRRRLRTILRRHRDNRGLTQDQVAVALDWSLSKVIRIESGSVGISVTDLRALLSLYGVTDTAPLIELARSARKAPWWQTLRDQMPPGFVYATGLEPNATRVCHFQGAVVPGLIQTMDYALEAIRGNLPKPASPEELDKLLEIRRRRQSEFFDQEEPPEFQVVLDEAVIRRRVGDADVMRAQLLRLVELNQQDHVSIQVVPFAKGIYPGHGAFILMDFDEDEIPSMLYREGPYGVEGVERGEDVELYRATFNRLRSLALSPDETSDFIRRAAADLD